MRGELLRGLGRVSLRAVARRVPWGLVAFLAIYAAAVLAYVDHTYWSTPEYQAAKAWERGAALLGSDDGRSCSAADFEQGFRALLEAARLQPEDPRAAERIEVLRWRAEERHLTLPKDLLRHAELVSAMVVRVQKERAGWLPHSAHDLGLTPAQLLASPTRVVLWSIPGALLMVMVWVVQAIKRHLREAAEERAGQDAISAEVEALGAFRRGLPGHPPLPPGDDR